MSSKVTKFNTAPLLLLVSARESLNSFLDLDSSIYNRWEDLDQKDAPTVAQRKELSMLACAMEWFSLANEYQKQQESEK